MTVKFARKAAGFYVAPVTEGAEFAATKGSFGWSLVLRDSETRKITARLATGVAALGECKATAQKLTASPAFAAVLLNVA